MPTKVVNIEDTMPYVEPPKVVTAATVFRESIEFSLELAQDQYEYFRDAKAVTKAAIQNDVATILKEVAQSEYPESKMESVLDRLRRVYMELTTAQVDAQDAQVDHLKKTAKPKTEPVATQARTLTDSERAKLKSAVDLIKEVAPATPVATHVPSNADVKAQEAKDAAAVTATVPKALTAGTTK